MAKRKEVQKIIVEERIIKEKLPPKCFGGKEGYCKEEYCGEWFGKCFNESFPEEELPD